MERAPEAEFTEILEGINLETDDNPSLENDKPTDRKASISTTVTENNMDTHQTFTVFLPQATTSISTTSFIEGTTILDNKVKGRVGRPRIKPVRERTEWHYHLGGVRHSRVPLSADIKEVLEVAYVSRIMSKNFRKEGQPEKERIAKITGMELEKVQEWFKNRRKKDRQVSIKHSRRTF